MVEGRNGPPPQEQHEKPAWQTEIEYKVEHPLDARLHSSLKDSGFTQHDGGAVSTTWIDKKYLPAGVSARIKRVTLGGRRRFFWAFKKDVPKKSAPDSNEPEPSVKDEYEVEAPSEPEAIAALFRVLRSEFGVTIDTNAGSEKFFNTIIEKERTSFTCDEKKCAIGECAGVTFDFDTITAYAGVETKGKLIQLPPSHRVSILEIEFIGTDSPETRARILSCAQKLGITVTKENSSRSTKALIRSRLHNLGYM